MLLSSALEAGGAGGGGGGGKNPNGLTDAAISLVDGPSSLSLLFVWRTGGSAL
jgi:hypothetical protein